MSWYNQGWFRQIVWYALGTGAAAGLCLVDYRTMARWSLVVYALAMLLLVAVLLIGSTHNWGARRWIDLGPFQFQPSEFAKLAFILAQAHFLSRPAEELRSPWLFGKALGLMLLPFALILVEPDLGSALVLLPTALVSLFVAGAPKRYLVRLLGGLGLLAALLLVDVLFTPPGCGRSSSRITSANGCWFILGPVSPPRTLQARKKPRPGACNLKSHTRSARRSSPSVRAGCAGKAGAMATRPPWVFCRRARRIMISFSP